jgi:hypothetical protein
MVLHSGSLACAEMLDKQGMFKRVYIDKHSSLGFLQRILFAVTHHHRLPVPHLHLHWEQAVTGSTLGANF